MFNSVRIAVLLLIILLFSGCSSDKTVDKVDPVDITGILSSIGAVGDNTNDFDTQRFQFTITLKNNEPTDITIISLKPVLSEKFLERAADKNVIIPVNQIISSGGSLDVSGEIIFDAKGLTKEQIVGMEPFIQEVKLTDERTIHKSF
ncbi:MAG: hypothetical protein VB084_03190 [Syntrophomonadaceae bacterium]|nr:hypothetical protein [Syntrophomonadaceae bacterium]